MAARELVMNGIEANLRNQQNATEDEKEQESYVLVSKDHIYENKFCVANVGGDYLTEKTAVDHLATIADSGNYLNTNLYDINQGQGAKSSYLPRAELGLLYRSKPEESKEGIHFQLCRDSYGLYHIRPQYCAYTEELTEFPICTSFSKPIAQSHGTEAVCMGSTELENTWETLDAAARGTKSEGTGYGLFKFLENRFWNEPLSPVKVQIYKTDGAKKGSPRKIKGFKYFIQENTTVRGSFLMAPAEGVPLGTKAYWAVIPERGEDKYNSNKCDRGYTSIAWRGENYHDITTNHLTNIANLKSAGIIYKSNRVVIVYEIPNDVANIKTDGSRTKLYKDGKELDLFLFNNTFRDQLKYKAPSLFDWLETQVVNKSDVRDHKKWLSEAAKQFKIKVPTILTDVSSSNQTLSKNKEGEHKAQTVSQRKKNEIERRKQAIGRDGAYRLRRLETPDPELIEDPDAPLTQFLLEEYKILVNKLHPLYEHRCSKCVKSIENCVVSDKIENNMFLFICRDTLYKIWEIHTVFGNTKTLHEKKQMWSPEVLSGCWSSASDLELLRKARKDNEQRSVFKVA